MIRSDRRLTLPAKASALASLLARLMALIAASSRLRSILLSSWPAPAMIRRKITSSSRLGGRRRPFNTAPLSKTRMATSSRRILLDWIPKQSHLLRIRPAWTRMVPTRLSRPWRLARPVPVTRERSAWRAVRRPERPVAAQLRAIRFMRLPTASPPCRESLPLV